MRDWLTQSGAGPRATRRLEHIFRSIIALRHHPCRHPHTQMGRREFTVEGHRVIYRVDPDTGLNDTAGNVTVVRVFGPGQSRDLV